MLFNFSNIFVAFLQVNTGSRAYILSDGEERKQVTLPLRIVNGLSALNTGTLRLSIQNDKKFMKMLLISCVGLGKITENQIDDLAMNFIKGNF